MPDIDTLRSYLVGLGFSIDTTGYNKFQQVLKDLSRTVEQHTAGMVQNYVKAGGIITSVLSGITASTVALMDTAAQADLSFQKFGLRMYMSADAARRMKMSMDAMGESLQDIAWNPELRGRYFALQGDLGKMGQPGDFKAQMKYLRDVRFEFTRLKLEMTEGSYRIGYYLSKHLGGGIAGVHGWLTKLNDYIVSHMDEWANKIAKVLRTILQLGEPAWKVLTGFWEVLEKIWTSLTRGEKTIALFAAAFWVFGAAGPVGKAIIILSTLLIALEDFYGYVEGKKSSTLLAPIWGQLLTVSDTLKKSFGDLWNSVKQIYKTFTGGLELKGWDNLEDIVEQVAFHMGQIVRGISIILSAGGGLMEGMFGPGQEVDYYDPASGMPIYKQGSSGKTPEAWKGLWKQMEDMANARYRHERRMSLSPDERRREQRQELEKRGLVAPGISGGAFGGSAAPGASFGGGGSNVNKTMNFLMSQGMTRAQAAGAVGWMMGESGRGLDPGINEKNPLIPGSRGGFGIAQWTGSRRRALEAFAASRGKPASDLETQFAFMATEPEFAAAMKGMRGVTTPAQGAHVWGSKFEKPNDFLSAYRSSAKRAEEVYRNANANVLAFKPSASQPGTGSYNWDIGDIHIDARGTDGDADLIADKLVKKMEEFRNRAVTIGIREQMAAY